MIIVRIILIIIIIITIIVVVIHSLIHSFMAPLTRSAGLRLEHNAPISRRSALHRRSSVQQGMNS